MKLLLGIDVEDWFQVENLKQAIDMNSWSSRESRIENNVEIILSLLNESNTKATFFVVGWIAEKFPLLIRKIHSEGHEIACHGYSHISSGQLNDKELYEDIKKSKNILEDIISEKICGYRAPNFSISASLVNILSDLNFSYDSSLMNSSISRRYGKIEKIANDSAQCFKLTENLYELQLSSLRVFNQNLPWAGGSVFRFIPYNVFKKGMEKIISSNSFYNFYIHPWEFDPSQPKIKKIKFHHKFLHYYNLNKTEMKFTRLLRDFSFFPIRSYLLNGLNQVIDARR